MGPYLMPHFDAKQIDQHQLDSIAALHPVDPPPRQRGRLGDLQHRPDPRGDRRLVHGLAALVIVARLIGERTA